MGITFDDGPHPEGTPGMLEILRGSRARATFFLCGEQVERYPALAAEILAAGHAIALHGYRHRVQLRLTPGQLADDLDRGLAAIEDAAGVSPRTYRPPLGIFSPPGLRAVRARGLRPLLWSRWGHDWRRFRSPTAIMVELSNGVRGGDVLLLHDSDRYSGRDCWRNTAAALPAVLGSLEAAGLGTTIV